MRQHGSDKECCIHIVHGVRVVHKDMTIIGEDMRNKVVYCYKCTMLKWHIKPYSVYSRTYCPLLLYNYKSDEDVINQNHKYNELNDDKRLECYKRSERRCIWKMSIPQVEAYKHKTYLYYCGKHNFSVTYFGLDPNISLINYNLWHFPSPSISVWKDDIIFMMFIVVPIYWKFRFFQWNTYEDMGSLSSFSMDW